MTRRDIVRSGAVLAGGAVLAAASGTRSRVLPAAAATTSEGSGHHPVMGFVLTSEQYTGPQLLELAVAADQAGFDAAWTSDHSLPSMSDPHRVRGTRGAPVAHTIRPQPPEFVAVSGAELACLNRRTRASRFLQQVPSDQVALTDAGAEAL